MRVRTNIAILAAVAGLALALAPAAVLAQRDQGHSHAEVKPAQTFSEAVSRIREEQAELTKLLAANSIVAAHEPADAIAQLARSLGGLSLKPGSGVAKEKVKDVNLAGKDLAKVAGQMHDAADKSDAAACTQLLPKLNELIAKLSGFSPEKWVCDMFCEPGKVFDGPGVCPVCKMPYKPVSQVPYTANVAPSQPLQAGGKSDLTVRLIDPLGNIVKLNELEVVHEQPLHLLMVSSDLSWYAHEHPTPQADGSFKLSGFSFPAPGEYTLFHDYTPKGKPQQVAKFKLKVPGDAPAAKPLVEDYDVIAKIDGYEFRVRCNGGKFKAGQDSILRFGIDRDGAPVTDLEPYLGAMGHLVIISQDLTQFVHSHPLDMDDAQGHEGGESHAQHDGHADGHDHAHVGHDHAAIMKAAKAAAALDNGKPSDVVFHVVFPNPGLYKGFAQFQHKGKILTYPFVVDAEAGEGGAQDRKHDEAGHDHNHGASGEKK
jgi:rubrerythrin